MNKVLNILIIVLLTVGLVNLFGGNNQPKTGLDIDFSSNDYTIPASVVIKVSNHTDKKVSLNTCDNIEIRKSGEKLLFDKNFCKNITVEPNNVFDINYQDEYKYFLEPGKYQLKSTIGEREFTGATTIGNKLTITKLFTTLIYAPIYNLFMWLIGVFNGSFGWAIIVVTIIIKAFLIWPQHKIMVSQRKLQALQPKIKKIQEENKGNQQAIGMKVLELYKKEKINPFASGGFLFIQLPIIIVLYRIILGIQDYSNTYYIYSFVKGFDFSKIDFSFLNIDLLQIGGVQGLVLALIVGFIQFLQIKLSLSYNKVNTENTKGVVLEKKTGDNKYSQMMPDTKTMNKFMLYVLPVIIGIATYTFFAGVGIYWGISTLFMLIQQVIVNKMLKKSS